MRKALIAGVTGQDGSYLAELLLEKGYEVHGLLRRSSVNNTGRIGHLLDRLHLHHADISDGVRLCAVLAETLPDEIYNLAAMSDVGISFEEPAYTVATNAVGAISLFEAARHVCPHARIYQACSSEMFGKVQQTPQTEETPFHPCSPYGCSKVFDYYAAMNYREAYGMFVCSGILFNHESPRRGENFVTRKITQAVARIAGGDTERLRLGNLEAQRDWGFAGDFVRAMWLMLRQDQPDDFVVATGETHSVRDFAERAFTRAGLDYREWVVTDPAYRRPLDVDLLLGDPAKARRVLRWEPSVTFGGLVDLMVDADRAGYGVQHQRDVMPSR